MLRHNTGYSEFFSHTRASTIPCIFPNPVSLQANPTGVPKISAVIITQNEEKNIGRCLDSLQGIADEILVVDSFSTDGTGAICKTKGAHFLQHIFEGHIQQKNYAASMAQHNHVLSLDADEALSEKLKQSILSAKENWDKDGYFMNRFSNYCGQWIRRCGWYPDRKLRLFDRRKGIWGGINPHDKYEMTDGSSTGFLEGDLLHYTYYSVEEHLLQADKFSSIAAAELARCGAHSSWPLIIVKPIAKFIRNYIIKLGFLDGYYGFVICKISAWETYLKYFKLKKILAGKDIKRT